MLKLVQEHPKLMEFCDLPIQQFRDHALVKLDVHSKAIGVVAATVIKWLCMAVDTVDTFWMGHNELADDGMVPIAEIIHANCNVTCLKLYGNQITDKGSSILAESLYHNGILTSLDLSRNCIGLEGATWLGSSLAHNAALRRLDLRDQKPSPYCYPIGNEGAKALAVGLTNNNCLTELLLSGNVISNDGAFALARAIVNHPSLKTLLLSNNQIGDEGVKSFGRVLQTQNTVLEKLWLNGNSFGDHAILDFMSNLQSNQVVEEINLGKPYGNITWSWNITAKIKDANSRTEINKKLPGYVTVYML